MIRLEVATVLLQWATGGMFFCWFTTRRRVVGLGYGWLLRGTFAVIAVGSLVTGLRYDRVPVRDVASAVVAATCLTGLAISVIRRRADVRNRRADHDRRSERVAEMTGIVRQRSDATGTGPEFPPLVDLLPVVAGVVGLVAAAGDAASGSAEGSGRYVAVALARTLVGAAFIGAITDAMLLGHWYLVQPGLPRRLLNELVGALGWVWPAEVAVMLLPTGMLAVLAGNVDDGWNGTLGWFWVACALSTIVLVVVTNAALRERQYSAVMAATGLLYLALLTAFGTDLVARAVLAG
ncbi:MAG: hypothetical protein H0X61_08435 [Acidimicrobiia bacterium]|nr:hypothetical protein [Acidimicrobiia bacterium]MBA3983545.1 hypothetical protein [Acidimicrobiia bacterium]